MYVCLNVCMCVCVSFFLYFFHFILELLTNTRQAVGTVRLVGSKVIIELTICLI